MKFVTGVLVKLGILNDDLDYHFVRLHGDHLCVLCLSEMVQLRGTGPDSSHEPRAFDILDVPCLRHSGCHMVLRCC